MKMTLVLFSRLRLRLGIASNNVSDAPSVADKLILILLWPRLSGYGFVVVDKRYVRLVVGALYVCNRRLHKCHAGRRCWSLIDRVHCVRIGDRDLEAQRRLVTHGFHAVDVAVRNLNQESFFGDERFLAFDRETDLPALHDPPRAIVRMKPPRRLLSRS